MAALRDRWLQAAECEKVLDTPDHPQWLSAARFVHEAIEPKPASSVKFENVKDITDLIAAAFVKPPV